MRPDAGWRRIEPRERRAYCAHNVRGGGLMKARIYLVRASVLAALIAGVAAVLAAAVFASPPGSFAAPEIRVSPPIVNFGSVAAGDTKVRMVSITNISDHSIRIASYGISQPPPYALFQWRQPNDEWPPCPEIVGPDRADLLPGTTCRAPLYVEPPSGQAPGTYEASFQLAWWNNLVSEPLLSVPLTVKVR